MSQEAKIEGGIRTNKSFITNKTEKPLLTIITVVYNGAEFLEKTIQSVIDQANESIEYIVMDGGSTDGTSNILRLYDHFIGYWVSEKDMGIYDAMNKGWNLAEKDSHILYLGAGDLIYSLPSIDKLVEYKDHIIYGTVMLNRGPFKSEVNWKLKLGNTIHHQAMLVPKKVQENSPFNTKFKTYADYDFNLRLFHNKKRFIFSGDFKAYALPGGLSSQINVLEMARVSIRHNGLLWGALSYLYCKYQSLRTLDQ